MSAPFQPGDCVVCVDDRRTPYGAVFMSRPELTAVLAYLRRGSCYRIAAVTARGRLRLAGAPWPEYDSGGYNPARFRKIDDEVTEEFRTQLRSLKSKSPAASSPAGSEDVCPHIARTSSPHIPEAGLRRPPSEPGCVPARALVGE